MLELITITQNPSTSLLGTWTLWVRKELGGLRIPSLFNVKFHKDWCHEASCVPHLLQRSNWRVLELPTCGPQRPSVVYARAHKPSETYQAFLDFGAVLAQRILTARSHSMGICGRTQCQLPACSVNGSQLEGDFLRTQIAPVCAEPKVTLLVLSRE